MKITARAYNYIPSEEEEFMNTKQLEYFKNLLLNWEAELNTELESLNADAIEIQNRYTADKNEEANCVVDLIVLEKNKIRILKVLDKIHYSLKKISLGTYGFCEETGEPISIKRLLSRPIATLCINAQEAHEKRIH